MFVKINSLMDKLKQQKEVNQLRKRLKNKLSIYTQSSIAKKLRVSDSYLSMVLNGKREPKDARAILSKALDYFPDDKHN